jgi:hypothetical protein
MDTRKEPIISGCLVLLFCVLREIYPESVVAAGAAIGLLLIARALYVYWYLIDGEIKQDAENSMDSDITGLYVLVRFYQRHGWSALLGTLGNITLSGLVFIGSVMSLTPAQGAL